MSVVPTEAGTEMPVLESIEKTMKLFFPTLPTDLGNR